MNYLATKEIRAEDSLSLSRPAGGPRRALSTMFSWPAFLGAMVAAAAVMSTICEQVPIIGGKVFIEGDTWWHIAVGNRILATHTWPAIDTYSFTLRGAPWIAYGWLAEVLMALVHRVAGLEGLAGLLVSLAVATALLLYYFAWLRSQNHLAAAAAAVLVLPPAAASFTMRPQMIGYCLLLVTFIYLERFQQKRSNSLWALPFIFLLWVNIHASFVLGFVVLALYWICGLVEFSSGFLISRRWTPAERRHLLFVFLLCLAAATITPYGTRLAGYPLGMVLRQQVVTQVIGEWQPISFADPFAQVFILLLLIALVAQVVSPVDYRPQTLALMVFTIAESCMHARFLIVFAIVFAPVLADILAPWLPKYDRTKDHPAANAMIVGALALVFVALFPSRSKLQQVIRSSYPLGAIRYLRQHPIVGNMFNVNRWGGYLIWALPQQPVFIDGRADIYAYGGVLLDYYKFINLRVNPNVFVGRYDLRAALVEPGTNIATYFAALAGWQEIYKDATSVIFVRGNDTVLSRKLRPRGPEKRTRGAS